MILRIFAFALLLASVLFFPFWISAILALAMMAFFSYFVEAILLFLFSDLLFGVTEPKLFGIIGVSFFCSIFFFITIELIKKKLRFKP